MRHFVRAWKMDPAPPPPWPYCLSLSAPCVTSQPPGAFCSLRRYSLLFPEEPVCCSPYLSRLPSALLLHKLSFSLLCAPQPEQTPPEQYLVLTLVFLKNNSKELFGYFVSGLSCKANRSSVGVRSSVLSTDQEHGPARHVQSELDG